MKTTRKGFTLIELIVVIAIIGVLAAILVPAMLGYVKKSKVNAANSDAKTLITTFNAAIEEMDEEGETVNDGWYQHGATLGETGGTGGGTKDNTAKLVEYLGYYSDAALSNNYAVCVNGGSAVCAVTKSGKYYGTYPPFLTNKNYDKLGQDTKPTTLDLTAVKSALLVEYNKNHTGDSALTAWPTGSYTIGTEKKS